MSTKTENGAQHSKAQHSTANKPEVNKATSTRPEEETRNEKTNPEKLHTPGKTPIGGKPSENGRIPETEEEMRLAAEGKEITGQEIPHPEQKDKRDTHNTGKMWNTVGNPDEHGTPQQKEDITGERDTEESIDKEDDQPQPGTDTPKKEGQQEEETPMPKTPPSEWEVKGDKDKPAPGHEPRNTTKENNPRTDNTNQTHQR